MKIASIFFVLILTACARPHSADQVAGANFEAAKQRNDELLSNLRRMDPGIAETDATRAVGMGDRSLLSVGGLAPTVPGVSDEVARHYKVRRIKGAGDNGPKGFTQQDFERVEEYARRYNIYVLKVSPPNKS